MDIVDPYAPPQADLELPRSTAAPALWHPDAAGLWSLPLSPIFGASLVWLNWKAIGDARRAQGAMFWLLASIAVTVLLWLVERRGFGILYLILWYFAAQRPQTLYLKKTWPEGYPRKRWRAPLLIGFGAVIALIVLFVPIGGSVAPR